MEVLKKFFKIFSVLVLFLILGTFTFFYFNGKKLMKERALLVKRVESFESDNHNDYFRYSIAFNKAGDFSNGFKYLDTAVAMNPKIHLGYRAYIRLRFMRDYDKALEDLNRLDSLTPNYIDAAWGEDIDFLRGECFFGKNDFIEAKKYFNQSIENQGEDWSDVQSFVYIGICEYWLGNIENAIDVFNKTIKQYPETCEAHSWLSKLYLSQGEIDKAKKQF